MKLNKIVMVIVLLFTLNSLAKGSRCKTSKDVEFMTNRILTGLTCSTKQEPNLCNDMIESTSEAYTANVGAVVAAGFPTQPKDKTSSFDFINFIFNRAYASSIDGILNPRESFLRKQSLNKLNQQLGSRMLSHSQRTHILSEIKTLESKIDFGQAERIRYSVNKYREKVEAEVKNETAQLSKEETKIKSQKPNPPQMSDDLKNNRNALSKVLGKSEAYAFTQEAKHISIREMHLDPEYRDFEGKPLAPDQREEIKDFYEKAKKDLTRQIQSQDAKASKAMQGIFDEQRKATKKYAVDTKDYYENSSKQLKELGEKKKSLNHAKEMVENFNSHNLRTMDAEALKASARGLSTLKLVDNPAIEKSRKYLAQNMSLVIDMSDRYLSRVGELAFKKIAKTAGKGIAIRTAAFFATGGLSTLANAAEGASLAWDAGSYGVTKLRTRYDKDCQAKGPYEVMEDCEPYHGLSPQFMGFLLADPKERWGAMNSKLCDTLNAVYDLHKPDSIELVSCSPNNENFRIYDPQLDDEFDVYFKDGKWTRIVGAGEHHTSNFAVDFSAKTEQATVVYSMNNNIFTTINLNKPSTYKTYTISQHPEYLNPPPKSTRASKRKSRTTKSKRQIVASANKMTSGINELGLCCNGSEENFNSTMCKRYQRQRFKKNVSPPTKIKSQNKAIQ